MLATLTGSQLTGYGQQFQKLDNAINTWIFCDSKSIDDESEKKHLTSQNFTHNTKKFSFESFISFISYKEIPFRHYSIRAPP